MIRLFLTGDNHYGRKYHQHVKSNEIVQLKIEALKNMVQLANDEKCDFLCIPGDLFDSQRVIKRDVTEIFSILKDFEGYVVYLPGNHDYYDEQSKLWEFIDGCIKDSDSIIVLNKNEVYELSVGEDEVFFYPAACFSKTSAPNENNLGWIKEHDFKEEGIRIGIAHGALEAATMDEGQYFFMSKKELEDIPVDGWLVGHTHVPVPRDLEDKYRSGTKIFNAGSPVQNDSNNDTEGYAFILEFEKDQPVKAKKVNTGNMWFKSLTIHIQPGKLEENLDKETKDFSDNTVLDIHLTGMLNEDEYSHRNDIIEETLKRFLEVNYEDNDISKEITKEAITNEFAENSIAATLLLSLLNDPKETQMAYDVIEEIKGKGK